MNTMSLLAFIHHSVLFPSSWSWTPKWHFSWKGLWENILLLLFTAQFICCFSGSRGEQDQLYRDTNPTLTDNFNHSVIPRKYLLLFIICCYFILLLQRDQNDVNSYRRFGIVGGSNHEVSDVKHYRYCRWLVKMFVFWRLVTGHHAT